MLLPIIAIRFTVPATPDMPNALDHAVDETGLIPDAEPLIPENCCVLWIVSNLLLMLPGKNSAPETLTNWVEGSRF